MVDGRLDGWMDGWMDGLMEKWTFRSMTSENEFSDLKNLNAVCSLTCGKVKCDVMMFGRK